MLRKSGAGRGPGGGSRLWPSGKGQTAQITLADDPVRTLLMIEVVGWLSVQPGSSFDQDGKIVRRAVRLAFGLPFAARP
ncbi:hypothetical protein GCM10010532_075410 [Dactylosporangium siamense]|uniref:Uncharacterized protein n=1 Tax=Dactylosporangium siamense TaxID=685454 RepID=A0A919PSX6_9ACTN|nr:hypothetical protein Dsi01nite_058960 [Dactylosporangium siamense]